MEVFTPREYRPHRRGQLEPGDHLLAARPGQRRGWGGREVQAAVQITRTIGQAALSIRLVEAQ